MFSVKPNKPLNSKFIEAFVSKVLQGLQGLPKRPKSISMNRYYSIKHKLPHRPQLSFYKFL